MAINQAIVHLLNGRAVDGLITAALANVDHLEVRQAVLSSLTLQGPGIRSGGFVLETVTAAIWSLFQAQHAEEVIVTAVSLGADSDTTGTVAGALAGARWGASGLPDRWLTLLQPREEITQLAAALYSLSTDAA